MIVIPHIFIAGQIVNAMLICLCQDMLSPSKSFVRIVAADDWMNRDTTCCSARPLLLRGKGEAYTA